MKKSMKGMVCFRRFSHEGNEDAKGYFEECLSLDPEHTGAYVMLRRNEEAVEAHGRALKESPDFLLALVGLMAAYAGLGCNEEAGATAAGILHMDPRFSVRRFIETLPCKRGDDRHRLAEALRKAGLRQGGLPRPGRHGPLLNFLYP